ncbi:nitric oxide reductase NorD protein [Paucibacter oligotrophus]|uniref:Nitric oxide reductase NorD protein n=1 Tax=Roseateles oligotrophus TaxID=1769250 RepID=A0A840L7P2_9BURK|nr:VWA domain-containing protein [Roseateles oligotrophus]MBB4844210.1 nitric oxide reductase NorD protein [Roseateles oligotrophus]
MEEWVGERWHRFIKGAADRSFAAAAVALPEVSEAVALLYRAAGGAAGTRVVPAADMRIGGPRSWLQRLAGSGLRAALPRLDEETLALPPRIALFADRALNRDLYLWLAALAAAFVPSGHWAADNLAATRLALQRCPGLRPRWERLREAHLAQRRADALKLPMQQQAAEQRLQALLLAGDEAAESALSAQEAAGLAPVWLWLQALPPELAVAAHSAKHQPRAGHAAPPQPPDADLAQAQKRRRTRQAKPASERAPLLLSSKAESLQSWSEHIPLDRGQDDEPDDEQAQAAADDMEQLTLSRDGSAVAARVKFDLDLPSASADDLPLGEGELLPEWDWKRQRLLPGHCQVQTLVTRPGASPLQPSAALRRTARQVRRRLELLRAAPKWQRGCSEGETLDLDAWVRHLGAVQAGGEPEPQVYARRQRGERSLATLLLADLSLSTDAYANNDARVIEVIRDALFVFGEALHACGDPFAMLGFSSVRRSQVRIQHLKSFEENWSGPVTARLGAIKPGYYTRMGAAIRLASKRLEQRPERQRLLLLLTDGKPNDLDVYEGRWGVEDTREAVLEARRAGLQPFCLSIDAEAPDYLPHIFGRQGWARVVRPSELPMRLAGVYAQLTR